MSEAINNIELSTGEDVPTVEQSTDQYMSLSEQVRLDVQDAVADRNRALSAADEIVGAEPGARIGMHDLVSRVSEKGLVSRRVARDVLRILGDNHRWEWTETAEDGTMVEFAPDAEQAS